MACESSYWIQIVLKESIVYTHFPPMRVPFVKGIIRMCLGYNKVGERASKKTWEYIQERVIVLKAEAQSDIMYMKVRLENHIT